MSDGTLVAAAGADIRFWVDGAWQRQGSGSEFGDATSFSGVSFGAYDGLVVNATTGATVRDFGAERGVDLTYSETRLTQSGGPSIGMAVGTDTELTYASIDPPGELLVAGFNLSGCYLRDAVVAADATAYLAVSCDDGAQILSTEGGALTFVRGSAGGDLFVGASRDGEHVTSVEGGSCGFTLHPLLPAGEATEYMDCARDSSHYIPAVGVDDVGAALVADGGEVGRLIRFVDGEMVAEDVAPPTFGGSMRGLSVTIDPTTSCPVVAFEEETSEEIRTVIARASR